MKLEDKKLLLDIGQKKLADDHYANNLLMLPYPYYQLLVLCHNFQLKKNDPDLAEIFLDQSIKCADLAIKNKICLTIPEKLIDILRATHRDKANEYSELNTNYYKSIVHPLILQKLLERLQYELSLLEAKQKKYDVILPIYNDNDGVFSEVRFNGSSDAPLFSAIFALKNPAELTLSFIDKYRLESAKFPDVQKQIKMQGP